MRADTIDLPSALHHVANKPGLVYLTHRPSTVSSYPIACSKLPILPEKGDEVNRFPVQANFHFVVLDMDKPEDLREYETTMSYLASGWGMKLVNLERTLVTKEVDRGDGTMMEQQIRRVYLEYYAPYRLVPPTYSAE